MTTPIPSTAAQAFKNAMTNVAIPAAVNDSTVLVSFGHPGMQEADDMIGTLRVTSQLDFATMSTNRTREELLTLQVMVSCYRGGGPEAEQAASDRAYQLLALIEQYVRVTDTTVAGTVRDCFLTAHDSSGSTDPTLLAQGRLIEIDATFTARVRISSSYL